MNYKQIPFDINIAKDIVSGKVDGKITTTQENDVTIYDFCFRYNTSKYQSNQVFPIVGKIHYSTSEEVGIWTIEGKHSIRNISSMDLVLWVKDEKVFKPFDRILVSYYDSNLDITLYVCRFFSHYVKDGNVVVTTNGGSFSADKVLPFEGNEHLVGTGTSIDK